MSSGGSATKPNGKKTVSGVLLMLESVGGSIFYTTQKPLLSLSEETTEGLASVRLREDAILSLRLAIERQAQNPTTLHSGEIQSAELTLEKAVNGIVVQLSAEEGTVVVRLAVTGINRNHLPALVKAMDRDCMRLTRKQAKEIAIAVRLCGISQVTPVEIQPSCNFATFGTDAWEVKNAARIVAVAKHMVEKLPRLLPS